MIRSLACSTAALALAVGCTQTTVPQRVEFYRLFSTYPSAWVKKPIVDPRGVVWFVVNAPNSTNDTIGRMSPDGAVSIEPLRFDFKEVINGLARSPDGSIWFTVASIDGSKENRVERLSPSGAIKIFPLPRWPGGIAAAPDGSIWFTQVPDRIARITSAGKFMAYEMPRAWSVAGRARGRIAPTGIALGPDGNMWATLSSINAIVRIESSGRMTKFDLPRLKSGPGAIAAGPDGNLWFTEGIANRIGRITPGGKITEFASPKLVDTPHDIAGGRENDLWFCEIGFVGRITAAGVISVHGGPGGTCGGIATDAAGNVWLTQTLGQPYSFSGPELGAIATFMPSDWISQVERH